MERQRSYPVLESSYSLPCHWNVKEQQVRSGWFTEGQENNLTYTPTSWQAAHEFDLSDYRKTVRDAGHHPIWAQRAELILVTISYGYKPSKDHLTNVVSSGFEIDFLGCVMNLSNVSSIEAVYTRGLKAKFNPFQSDRGPLFAKIMTITEFDQCQMKDQLFNPIKDVCKASLTYLTRDLQNLHSNISPDLRASYIVELGFVYPYMSTSNAQIRCGYENMWIQYPLRKTSMRRIDFTKTDQLQQ